MARERVVVVGAGGISNVWFRELAAEKVKVVGVVDVRLDAARGQIAKYALDCEASADLVGALKETRPEVVLDLTVPEAHCTVTCTALRAGCHVISEKPMANSMARPVAWSVRPRPPARCTWSASRAGGTQPTT